MTDKEQKQKAKEFAEFWKGKGYEKGQSQIFWTSLLLDVYGVEDPKSFVEFEDQVMMDMIPPRPEKRGGIAFLVMTGQIGMDRR